MQIVVGTNQADPSKQVAWDANEVINPHIIIVGSSGAGKTHTLNKCIREILQTSATPPRIHIFDVHGDITPAGASSVLFGESADYGINPLSINADPIYGGVRRCIQEVISIINKTSRCLGERQEAVFRAVLIDLFASNGYYIDKPESWVNVHLNGNVKHIPTLKDAHRFAHHRLKSIYTGTDSATMTALDKLARAAQKLARARAKNVAISQSEQTEVEKMALDLSERFSEYVKSLPSSKSGRELDDYIRYDAKDTLKSVCDRIENLVGTGIFKESIPPFDPRNPIWHADIKPLGKDEKKLFTLFRAKEIFRQAVQRGLTDRIRHVLVIDEAHMFMDDDPDNPLNIIAKEGRKFGVQLLLASQAPTHFSEDILSSVGCKIILGVDQTFWPTMQRTYSVDVKALRAIRMQETLLFQAKKRRTSTSSWVWVRI